MHDSDDWLKGLPENDPMDDSHLIDEEGLKSIGNKELAQLVIDAKELYKMYSDRAEANKEAAKMYEAEMIRRFIDEGQTSGTWVDNKTGRKKTLYIKEDINPIATFSYADGAMEAAFRQFVDDTGMGHLSQRTVGEMFQKFRYAVKDEIKRRMEAGEKKELPEGWDKYVDVRHEFKLNLRTGAGK